MNGAFRRGSRTVAKNAPVASKSDAPFQVKPMSPMSLISLTSSMPAVSCLRAVTLALLAVASALPVQAADTSPLQQLDRFAALAGARGEAERGRAFFTSRHAGDLACASCHGNPPVAPGKHASTGKTIEPLAPAANANAFTDTARVDKWLRRNCNDVLKRECTPAEKADLLAFLISVKP